MCKLENSPPPPPERQTHAHTHTHTHKLPLQLNYCLTGLAQQRFNSVLTHTHTHAHTRMHTHTHTHTHQNGSQINSHTYYFSRLLSQNGEGRHTITQAFCMGCICEHRFTSFFGPGSPGIVPAKKKKRRRRKRRKVFFFNSSGGTTSHDFSTPATSEVVVFSSPRWFNYLFRGACQSRSYAKEQKRKKKKKTDTSTRLLCGHEQRFSWSGWRGRDTEEEEDGGRRERWRDGGMEDGGRRRGGGGHRSCPRSPVLIDSPYAE